MTIRSQLPISGNSPYASQGRAVADTRISREDLYISIAKLFAQRSTCLRGHVGCVAVRENRLICAGYNGAPADMLHCIDVGCGGGVLVREGRLDPLPGGEMPRPAETEPLWEFPNGCTRAVHAEANMVAFAARSGVSLDGCTVYATHGPCLPCAQALVSSGIVKLVYIQPYRLPEGLQLVDQANIIIVRYREP